MTSEQREPVEHIDHEASVEVSVRRSPRYGRFLIVGGMVGVVVALILTTVFGPSMQSQADAAVTYPFGQVFGFTALIFVAVGVMVAGLVALLIDRSSARRTRNFTAEHDTVGFDEPEDEPEPGQAGQGVNATATDEPQASSA